jgi:hypothetical protein
MIGRAIVKRRKDRRLGYVLLIDQPRLFPAPQLNRSLFELDTKLRIAETFSNTPERRDTGSC